MNSQKLYVLVVMCMIMYKFGLRVGAVAKIRVCDLLEDNIIIFKEKNNRIIKRKLLPETTDILRNIINELELDVKHQTTLRKKNILLKI